MHAIPGISTKLNALIQSVLKADSTKTKTVQSDNAEKELVKLGLIDEDGMFVEPEKLKGELRIASKWLRDNI